MSLTANDVRHDLRRRTRNLHDRVDAAYGELSLEVRNDYALFLLAKYRVYQCLDLYFREQFPVETRPPNTSALLAADIETMDIVPQGAAGPWDSSRMSEPLGAAYLACGSHLGLKILRRQWQTSDDPLVRAAGAYMRSESMAEYWPGLQRMLAETSLSEQRHVNIVYSAEATFRLFLSALEAAKMELSVLGRY